MDAVSSSLGAGLFFTKPFLLSVAVILLPIIATYAWRWRYLSLVKKVPGYKDWPLVGDSFHFKRDPTGIGLTYESYDEARWLQ